MLEHEKYNLAEGFTFVNISYTLLGRGARFCTEPHHRAIVAEWEAQLEAGMDYHMSNHAFDELLDAQFKYLCTEPDDDPTYYDQVYDAVASMIDAEVLGTTSIEHCPDPKITDPSKVPDANDLINMFDQNTHLYALCLDKLAFCTSFCCRALVHSSSVPLSLNTLQAWRL